MIAHATLSEHVAVAAMGVFAVAAYAAAWLGFPTPRWGRLLAWVSGVVVTLAATSPQLERAAAGSFTGHMVQHLLLIVVVPPALVVARPFVTFGRLLPRRLPVERRLARWWHRTAWVVAPLCFLTVLFGTHLTTIYDSALRNRLLHDLEHVAYLAAAIALWAVVLAPMRDRGVGRVGSAFAVVAGTAVLGVVLTSANRPLVDTYVELLGRGEALRDQRQAAALMWVGGMALGLPLVMASVWRWASIEQRTALRSERLQDGRHHAQTGGQDPAEVAHDVKVSSTSRPA